MVNASAREEAFRMATIRLHMSYGLDIKRLEGPQKGTTICLSVPPAGHINSYPYADHARLFGLT